MIQVERGVPAQTEGIEIKENDTNSSVPDVQHIQRCEVTVLYRAILCCIVLYCTVPCYTVL